MPVKRSTTLTWKTPKAGAPEYEEVDLLELVPDAKTDHTLARTSRLAARLYTRETPVALPDEILQLGHLYDARVYAVQDGRDFAEPYTTKTTSRTTGLFLPMRIVEP